jgi:pilus assembly protein Flp/PilA
MSPAAERRPAICFPVDRGTARTFRVLHPSAGALPYVPTGDAASAARPSGASSQLEREVIQIVFHRYLGPALQAILPERDEDGQGLAEYALILALIAIVAIVALIYLGSQISDKLSTIGDAL